MRKANQGMKPEWPSSQNTHIQIHRHNCIGNEPTTEANTKPFTHYELTHDTCDLSTRNVTLVEAQCQGCVVFFVLVITHHKIVVSIYGQVWPWITLECVCFSFPVGCFSSLWHRTVKAGAFQIQAIFMVSHVHKVVVNLIGSSIGN